MAGNRSSQEVRAVRKNESWVMPPADADIRAELALANRILFRQGVLDAYGHVSVRNPEFPDRFFLSRNLAPALVGVGDILDFDADANPRDAGADVYLERFIHSEVYRSRLDVQSVVHCHSPSVIPFGIVPGTALRPVIHMAGFISDAAPVFEIRDVAGDATDLLIRDAHLGVALTKSLGNRSMVLMRGHGATIVAPSLKEAVFRAVYAALNARLQLLAQSLGEVTCLTSKEAASCTCGEKVVQRAWDLWKHQVAQG